MHRFLRLFALTAVVALLAAACAQEEAETPTAPGATTPSPTQALPGAGMKACQVTDVGGIDDKSFNQTAWAGVQRAQAELGVEGKFLESQTADDYMPNIQTFINEGCDIIITVGFLLGDATKAAAEANPDQPFAIVDFAYDPPVPNVLGLTFATDQAAFLAGYLAAGMTKTGKVATYGGIKIPPVTIFMDGFLAGVRKYNQDFGTDVQVLGWDGKEGAFTGNFENQDDGRRLTEDFISEGADIILPVAGPVGFGTTAALQDSPQEDYAIWVDTDGCVSASEFCSLFLTSIMKNMDVAVFEAIKSVVEGRFEGGVYVGTLENNGVGIAPFHEFEDVVPQELKDKLEELKQGIIDGTVSVKPDDYPA
ncbi:MAG TPA: BMP family ABC transporter substrate-binding protein [Actinomycetota bacterium]|nr:BMP family ABC transporter substrate-binding protein [Actinomycetota bacterium]